MERTIEELFAIDKEYKDTLSKLPEEWREIKVFDIAPLYKISNHGNIMKNDGKILYPRIYTNGYIEIYLHVTNQSQKKIFRFHRIVAATFIDVPQNYIDDGLNIDSLEVNHKNGIKHHNAVFNLEWCTPKENRIHAVKTGLVPLKFSPEIIHEVCKYLEEGKSNAFIREKTNVTDGTIYALVRGDVRKDIVSEYKIFGRRKELTDEIIHNICKDLIEGQGAYDTAAKYGISADYVYALRKNEYRPDITSQYDFSKSVVKDRLSEDVIRSICIDIRDKVLTVNEIAKKYNISVVYVKSIKYGKKKREISKDYF